MVDKCTVNGSEQGNKDTLKFDDSDGKLHLYVCLAFNGDRWANEMIFDNTSLTMAEFKRRGEAMVSMAGRTLLKAKIIS